MNALELHGLEKHYPDFTLGPIDLELPGGTVCGLIGENGAGKSTLVRCINLLERPTKGEIIVDGQRLDTMTPAQLRAARRNITMIFQHFNLLMQRNVLRNVCFPLELDGVKKEAREARAMELLNVVGLADKARAYPAQLSGGQKQRIAIAGILAMEPECIVLDEATASLDVENETAVQAALSGLIKDKTVLIIAHRMRTVMNADQIVLLSGGRVVEMGSPAELLKKNGLFRHMAQLQSESMEWTA